VIVTFILIAVSFYYTFPLMHDFIHSFPDSKKKTLLDFFLPLILIPAQVLVLFIPVMIYARFGGKVEKV
jgi:hypothetical protein